MKKKLLLITILLAACTFSFTCLHQMNKEQAKQEVKAEVAESFDAIVNSADELQQALDRRESVIHLNTSFTTNRQYTINYNVTINPYSASNGIGYSGPGALFTVNSGCTFTVSAIVVGIQNNGNYGATVIRVNNGGTLVFRETSIVDCTNSNNGRGIVLENGATANMYSSWTLKAAIGMYVKQGANLNYLDPD